MMKRFRIEVFNRLDLAFKSFTETEEPDINIDYLVTAESTLSCVGKLMCNRGDFAQVRVDGKVFFQGIVADWNYDGYRTEVTLYQLIELLNIESFADVSLLGSQSIEQWMTNLLTAAFNGTDVSARLPGLTISSESATSGAHAATDNGAYNLYDLAVYFFKIYGVILDISFEYKNRSVSFSFRTVSASALKLDLSVSDVREYEIEPANASGNPNKVIIRNQDNLSQQVTYYWHPTEFSGTIDTNDSINRVVPVVTQCDTVMLDEGQEFLTAAYARAEEILYKTLYDDLIHVTMKTDSKLISDWKIGQTISLRDGERTFNTMLTGIHPVNTVYVELTFGYVRKRLTQILKMRKGTI